MSALPLFIAKKYTSAVMMMKKVMMPHIAPIRFVNLRLFFILHLLDFFLYEVFFQIL
jgi:hypothetical protein